MSDSDHTPRIPHLSGKDNYGQWKVNMTDILCGSDLLQYIESDYTLPPTEPAKTTAEKADRKALSQIRLRTSAFAHTFVSGAMTAREAWDILQREFEVTGATSCIFLRRELYTT